MIKKTKEIIVLEIIFLENKRKKYILKLMQIIHSETIMRAEKCSIKIMF